MGFIRADPTVFVFGGQGTQYFGMGAYHFRTDEVFRESALDIEARLVAAGHPGVLDAVMERRPGDPFGMTDIAYSHPGIVMMQLALFDSVAAIGVVPDVVVGSSLGELVALCAAGVIERGWLLEAVVAQTRALQRHDPRGAMLAVLDNCAMVTDAPEEWAPLELAGVSASRHFVVSGPRDAVGARLRSLREKGIGAELAPVPYPFHSSLIEVIHADFARSVTDLVVRPTPARVVSCVTGRDLGEVTAEHLWRIVREPFRWQDAAFHIETSSAAAPRYVDLSPTGSMAGYLRMDFGTRVDGRVVALSGPFTPDVPVIERLSTVGIGLPPRGGGLVAPVDDAQADRSRSAVGSGRPTPARRAFVIPGQSSRLPTAEAEVKAPKRTAFVFPGQGSQRIGMGADVLDRYPDLVHEADEILGYSVRRLCLEDPDRLLRQTQYTQPALFVVGALQWRALRDSGAVQDDTVLAGHSLGEITALHSAGALDFASGLRLVVERSRLMGAVSGGAMAAVIGLSQDAVADLLASGRRLSIDVANVNSLDQIVISGPEADVRACSEMFAAAGARFVPLAVSGPFHSRYMREAAARFGDALRQTRFGRQRHVVVANVTAEPYGDDPASLLTRQLVAPVRWYETIGWLLDRGFTVTETGPGQVLTRLTRAIKDKWTVTRRPWPLANSTSTPHTTPTVEGVAVGASGDASQPLGRGLGSASFRAAHRLDYAYVCGGMYRGLASADLVCAATESGLLAYFGSGGLPLREVASAIDEIHRRIPSGRAFGVDVVHDALGSGTEDSLVDALIHKGVKRIEASAFMRVTPALVRYVVAGLRRGKDGAVEREHHLLAKVSRPEVAREFLAPPDPQVVARLVEQGAISAEQAALARGVPVADDLCVEGDSGGHTDRRNPLVLFPALRREAARAHREHGYRDRVRVGLAGGIGTPEAAAAAFVMGADFVLTGSINLCTVESGMSDFVKDMLETIDIQDTDYAPAGDMFELGAQVQVVRKGVFFPARARKLFELYRAHESLDALDTRDRKIIEQRYFKRSLADVWADTQRYFAERDPEQLKRAATDERHRMALIFRWYFGHSQRAAMTGDPDLKLDFQVHCGPALGSLNSWLRETTGEGWRARHVGELGTRLMDAAARVLATDAHRTEVGVLA